MDLKSPDIDVVPNEQREEILRACRESDDYKALGRRQAPRVMLLGGAITLLVVGLLVWRHDISLGLAVLITWAIFLLCIPPVRWWNRRQREQLLERLVRERIRQSEPAAK